MTTETILIIIAAFTGGVLGGFVTQITMFWLNGRKGKQERRRLAIEYTTEIFAKKYNYVGKEDPSYIARDAIAYVDNLTDDELSGLAGIVRSVSDKDIAHKSPLEYKS